MRHSCARLGTPEYFSHRLQQTSMTRATVEDSTAGRGQTLRTRRPLVGGCSFHDVSGLCTKSLAHGLPRGIQAQGMRHAADEGFVCRSGGRTTACEPHALGGAQCGEQRGSDMKHSKKQKAAGATSSGTFADGGRERGRRSLPSMLKALGGQASQAVGWIQRRADDPPRVGAWTWMGGAAR